MAGLAGAGGSEHYRSNPAHIAIRPTARTGLWTLYTLLPWSPVSRSPGAFPAVGSPAENATPGIRKTGAPTVVKTGQPGTIHAGGPASWRPGGGRSILSNVFRPHHRQTHRSVALGYPPACRPEEPNASEGICLPPLHKRLLAGRHERTSFCLSQPGLNK